MIVIVLLLCLLELERIKRDDGATKDTMYAQKLMPTKATDSYQKRRAYRLLAFAASVLVVAGGVALGFSIFR